MKKSRTYCASNDDEKVSHSQSPDFANSRLCRKYNGTKRSPVLDKVLIGLPVITYDSHLCKQLLKNEGT